MPAPRHHSITRSQGTERSLSYNALPPLVLSPPGLVSFGVLNKPIILAGVVAYSLLVGGLRHLGLIGDRGAFILFGFMVADLAATHWLLKRTKR